MDLKLATVNWKTAPSASPGSSCSRWRRAAARSISRSLIGDSRSERRVTWGRRVLLAAACFALHFHVVPRVNFLTSEYRIYLRVLRWLGRLIRTGARTLNGSGACAFYKLQLTRTNTRDKETERKKGDGRNTSPRPSSLWKTISPGDIYDWRHPRGYGNRGKQRRNRWAAAFLSCGIPGRAFSWRRSVAQIIISCASRRRKWNFVIPPQQRRVPFLFLRSYELKYLIIG